MTRQAKLRELVLDTMEVGVAVDLERGSEPGFGSGGGSRDETPSRLMSAPPHEHLEDLVLNEMLGERKTRPAVDIRSLRASALASS